MCDPPYGFSFMGKAWDYDVPSVDTWREVLRVLKPGAPLVSFGGSRTYHRLACGIEDAGSELRDQLSWLYGSGFPKSLNLKDSWDGYGTAPEASTRAYLPGDASPWRGPWWTISAGGAWARWTSTGRASTASRERGLVRPHVVREAKNAFSSGLGAGTQVEPGGRWPANLLLDEAASALLDAEVPPTKSGVQRKPSGKGGIWSPSDGAPCGPQYGDSGGPSRFFYTTKVSTKEREAGCEGLVKRSAGETTEREDDSAGLDSPRAGAGRTGGARNHHPTLKPISLTTWLARLILPPTERPILLVPFSGAGSEMIGAIKAGWPGVFGIEREAEYVQIARARLAHWCPESQAA